MDVHREVHMLELLMFFAGGAAVTPLTAVFLVNRKRKPVPVQADDSEYKQLWSEAVNLLAFNGQITDEQLKAITPATLKPGKPKAKAKSSLPRGKGFSSDRRDIEIERARNQLPPADSLEGMFSSDVREVQLARIKYGTAI